MNEELEKIAAALQRQDYRQAAQLLKPLTKSSPENPWVQLYVGQIYEASNKAKAAEKLYRQLLRSTSNAKILSQARQGLSRLERQEKQALENAIAQAKTRPGSDQLGVLILEPIAKEKKADAAKYLARLTDTDPYTARLQLPTRSWRLYRTGNMAELQVYSRQMRQGGIANFCTSTADIQQLHTFRVSYFQQLTPQPAVVCHDQNNQLGVISFQWSEVRAIVEGLLPLFIDSFDFDPRRPRAEQVRYKTKTHDYTCVCDLHLPQRQSILRFCDSSYNFHEGYSFAQQPNPTETSLQMTNRPKWNQLREVLASHLSQVPIWSLFSPFAETAVADFPELLSRLPFYMDISRKYPSAWDPAFQLYSGLVFCQQFPISSDS
ncbi:tetratricopeptide repeat protein [Geitlerinema sp. PCC 9228]|jgi:hypothetical protein|uniref:tetratricopeptide repeat protein n=1 Tax=Geitlerinema sp. PCC 9228 TaxID=111611 RepID=UPI0008F9D53D|nr:tetratricopeptide repeat protein [Geitlerinema sp. PCC 9228]